MKAGLAGGYRISYGSKKIGVGSSDPSLRSPPVSQVLW